MPQAQGVGLKRLTELHNYHALVSVETKINHMPEPKYMKPIHSRHVSYQTNYTNSHPLKHLYLAKLLVLLP